jgi:hypothetical protein
MMRTYARPLQATQELGLILTPGVRRTPAADDAPYLTHPDSKSLTGDCVSFGSVDQKLEVTKASLLLGTY